jgi:glutamate-1-semialdehyde 2,1-aminomutase
MQSGRQSSEDLFARARGVLAGGISHENRYVAPYPIYFDRALGSRKWDVEGREYVDFSMGSASQMLGHAHPDVVRAVQEQMPLGTFYGNCHQLEVAWGELVQSMVPSAERVRFVASGSEATVLALRLARAQTGKSKVIRFEGHFHGWHDHLLLGMSAPYDKVNSLGVLAGSVAASIVCKPSADAVEAVLRADRDVAAIFCEVSGANWGCVPIPDGFLAELRSLADRYNVVLVFDEVITGFRWSPGGVQALCGITPDLTTMAKVVTGGLPGGAVGGKVEIMELLDPQVTRHGRTLPVNHRGTFNGNPLVAAAAVAALRILKTGDVQKHADLMAERARAKLAAVLEKHEVLGCIYGASSTFQVHFGRMSIDGATSADIRGVPKKTVLGLQNGLRQRGVDLMSYMGGVTSLAHNDADVEHLAGAFDETIKEMITAGTVQQSKATKGKTSLVVEKGERLST